ncbi:MAG: hypothetical protein ACRCV0_02135 [Brevinema sp.]
MLVSRQENSPLFSYLVLSIGLHAFLLVLFLWAVPDIEESTKKVTITMNLGSSMSTAPVLPKPAEIPLPKATPSVKPQQIKKSVRKSTPSHQKINQKKEPVTPKKQVPPDPIKPKNVEQIKKTTVPTENPLPIAKVAENIPPKSIPVPIIEEIATPPVLEEKLQPTPVETTLPETIKPQEPKEEELLAHELENLLAQKKDEKIQQSDFLENASWSGAPRKTIIFPKITEQIPDQYKARGYGYSVTASMTFSPQGWVSSVELIKSSGDPIIDNIFRNELRKIRIEESSKNTYDTVVKTFTISIK